jgi:uncharacterized protein with PIN domain
LAVKGCASNCRTGGDAAISALKFIVDQNVGKLAGWLRMMGFDSLFFTGDDDSTMIKQALAEDRVLLTRDTGIVKRRLVSTGQLRAILLQSETPERQMRQLLAKLDLIGQACPFTLCLECNQPLVERSRDEVKDRVPPYVLATQTQYMECPSCRRIYWRGTHWQGMKKKLEEMEKTLNSNI